MRAQDYPPQDETSAFAMPYKDACIAGSFGVPFSEFRYGADPYQSVAVYPAEKPDGSLFAFIHGGGWTTGYKEWMGFMAPAFTAEGITFASIGYRLAPAHLHPAGLEDCAAAVKALLSCAPSLGCDPRKFFLGGHSAGGHFSALLAVRRDWQAALGLPQDTIAGCLPISGVYQFGEGSGLSMRPRFLGPVESGSDHAASPIFHIQDRPPPFLMAHGEKDFPHLRVQAGTMAEALRAAQGEVTALELAGRDHFSASLAGGEPDGPWVPHAVAFIKAT